MCRQTDRYGEASKPISQLSAVNVPIKDAK
jgi:hypothetical protein